MSFIRFRLMVPLAGLSFLFFCFIATFFAMRTSETILSHLEQNTFFFSVDSCAVCRQQGCSQHKQMWCVFAHIFLGTYWMLSMKHPSSNHIFTKLTNEVRPKNGTTKNEGTTLTQINFYCCRHSTVVSGCMFTVYGMSQLAWIST